MSDIFEKASVSSDLAHRIVAAAEAKAADMGVPMNIAVCDESGVLKAFSRMDGAALLSVQIAQDKAYTAVGFGMPTDGWHEFIKDDPPLAAGAVGGIDRLVIFGGGFPITVGDKVVGAIGVSGGHYTQDMEVAQAGLAVLASRHPRRSPPERLRRRAKARAEQPHPADPALALGVVRVLLDDEPPVADRSPAKR